MLNADFVRTFCQIFHSMLNMNIAEGELPFCTDCSYSISHEPRDFSVLMRVIFCILQSFHYMHMRLMHAQKEACPSFFGALLRYY